MPMPDYLDLSGWPRRDAFDHFRGFDKPYFNVCTRLDVAGLKQFVADSGHGSLALAYHYIALQLANRLEAFRLRLEGERVLVHAQVHASTTVLRDDGGFGFAYLNQHTDFATFAAHGAAAIAAARVAQAPFEPRQDDSALIHCTTLPWVHFSSFSHARNWGRADSIPKLAFGRIDGDGARAWMPLSVEVHHLSLIHISEPTRPY